MDCSHSPSAQYGACLRLGTGLGKVVLYQDLSYRASWDYKNHRMGESYQRLMRDYFGDESQEFIPPALVPSASKDLAAADALLAGCSAKGPKVLFCVETTAKAKDWRAEKFAALADWLITSYDASVIITGIEAHRPKMDAIKNRMKHPESIIDTLGKTTFPALVALMRRADCAITLDTGTTHIAAAAGCPVLTIFTFNSPEIYQGCGERTWAVSGHVLFGKACLHRTQEMSKEPLRRKCDLIYGPRDCEGDA